MKQDHYWQRGETAPRQGIFSRIVGATIFVASVFTFVVAAGASSAQVRGILDIVGIALISLALTLLITGWTYRPPHSDDESHS